MRLLAALAVIGAFGTFAAVSAPANAQVYEPVEFSLLCETGTTIIVDQSNPTITVTVLDANTNQPIQGVTVLFVTTGGTLAPQSDTTDAAGVAETVLDPGDVTDPIEVTAYLQDVSCDLTFEQEVLSEVFDEVVALPATGSGGSASGSSLDLALALLAALGFVGLAGVGLKVARR